MERFLLFWFTLLTSVASQGPCPTDKGIRGYSTVAGINNAMKLVLNSIQSGGQPKPTYLYTLCPGTVFSGAQALTPVLSGAEFICGANGVSSDKCVIKGGANHVVIENSKVTGYSLRNITFKGITFSGSTQSSIVAGAGSGTTAYFIDCKWFGFALNSAMTLFLATGKAMTVVITGSSFQNGTSSNIFNNKNGTLEINGISVSDSIGQAAIDTSNGGSTTVKNANFTSNDYVSLTITGKGSSLTATNVDVTSTGSNLQQFFYAEGTGSKMNLTGVNIHDNALDTTFWDAFTYAQGAKGGVYQSRLEGNSGVQFGVRVHDNSSAIVDGSTFESNTATVGGFSSVLIALNNSKLVVSNSDVVDNSGFSVYGFTGFQSFTQYDNTTFNGGSVTIPIFIDQDSTVGVQDIFFINVQSSVCPPPNQRLFMERVGSQCFYRGSGKCDGTCGVRRNNTLAPATTTSPPAIAPSVKPQKTAKPSPPQTTESPSPAPLKRPPTAPAVPRPSMASVAPTISSPPATPSTKPLPSASPTFGQSHIITFSPAIITFAPTIAGTKEGKKGSKKSKKKGSKKMDGKKSQKGEPPLAALSIVPSPPSTSPVLPIPTEPPHLLKKKKAEEKGAEKLHKKSKDDVFQKTVEKQYHVNVFERDRPKSSRRRRTRGL